MAEESHIEVAVIDSTVYLKPFGFATQQNCLGIPDFLEAMFRVGCKRVAFDLGECKGMDSTFLGVIADAATAVPNRPGKTVVVLNCRENALRQLRRIGLLPLVCVHEETVEPPQMQLSQIDFIHFPKTPQQRLQTIKRLHQQLTELNEKNKQLFGPFIAMLDEELQQRRQEDQKV